MRTGLDGPDLIVLALAAWAAAMLLWRAVRRARDERELRESLRYDVWAYRRKVPEQEAATCCNDTDDCNQGCAAGSRKEAEA